MRYKNVLYFDLELPPVEMVLARTLHYNVFGVPASSEFRCLCYCLTILVHLFRSRDKKSRRAEKQRGKGKNGKDKDPGAPSSPTEASPDDEFDTPPVVVIAFSID